MLKIFLYSSNYDTHIVEPYIKKHSRLEQKLDVLLSIVLIQTLENVRIVTIAQYSSSGYLQGCSRPDRTLFVM